MRRTATAVAVIMALGGCADGDGNGAPAPTTSAAPTSAAPTSAAPEPTARAYTYGAPFYSDDFDDKSKGWTEKSTDQVEYVVHDDYASPLYAVRVKAGRMHTFPRPEFRGVTRAQLTDYQVVADLQTTLAVSRSDYFGVTCRDLDGKRYSLSIGYDTVGEGTIPWRILEHGPDGASTLGEGTAKTPGGSAFEVAGTCAGGRDGTPADLVLQVNGTEIARVQDAETPLTEGYAGVYVFSDDGKTTVNVLGFAVRPAS